MDISALRAGRKSGKLNVHAKMKTAIMLSFLWQVFHSRSFHNLCCAKFLSKTINLHLFGFCFHLARRTNRIFEFPNLGRHRQRREIGHLRNIRFPCMSAKRNRIHAIFNIDFVFAATRMPDVYNDSICGQQWPSLYDVDQIILEVFWTRFRLKFQHAADIVEYFADWHSQTFGHLQQKCVYSHPSARKISI